jgi:hypothetical protein
MNTIILLLLSCSILFGTTLTWEANPGVENVTIYWVACQVTDSESLTFYPSNETTFNIPFQLTKETIFWVLAENKDGVISDPSLKVKYTPNRKIETKITLFNDKGVITLTGDMGKCFSLETSKDLKTWTPEHSDCIGQDDQYNFSFDFSTPQKFFRVKY